MKLFKKTTNIEIIETETKTEIISQKSFKSTKTLVALSIPMYIGAAALYFTSEYTGSNIFWGTFSILLAIFFGFDLIAMLKGKDRSRTWFSSTSKTTIDKK